MLRKTGHASFCIWLFSVVLQVIWEIDGRTNDGCLDFNEFVDHMCWHPRLCIKELMMHYESTKANRRCVVLKVESYLQQALENNQDHDHKSSINYYLSLSSAHILNDDAQNNSLATCMDSFVSAVASQATDLSRISVIKSDKPTQSDGIDNISPFACLPARSESIVPSSSSADSKIVRKSGLHLRCNHQGPAPPRPLFDSKLSNSQIRSSQNSKLASCSDKRQEKAEKPEFVGPHGAYNDWDSVGSALKNEDSSFTSKSMSSTGLWPSKPTRKFHTDFDYVRCDSLLIQNDLGNIGTNSVGKFIVFVTQVKTMSKMIWVLGWYCSFQKISIKLNPIHRLKSLNKIKILLSIIRKETWAVLQYWAVFGPIQTIIMMCLAYQKLCLLVWGVRCLATSQKEEITTVSWVW